MAKRAPPKIANERSLGREFEAIAQRLAPQKWTTLTTALSYVTDHLTGRPPATTEERHDTHCVDTGEKPKSDFGLRYMQAHTSARMLLIRLLAAADLPSRGVLHMAKSSEPLMLEPLPVIWWSRIFDNQYAFYNVTDALPLHGLSWRHCRIKRVMPYVRTAEIGNEPQEITIGWKPLITTGRYFSISDATPLATVTDIECDRPKLLEIVPPVGGAYTRSAVPSTRGRPPDYARIAAVKKLAKAVIKEKFGTVDKFASEVATRFSMDVKHGDGLEPKQVRRWILGDE